ncbi:hypothetical protein [Burkholderia sp. HI2714]|uniref:hypothetical protein n=1 Tax=Burkholderia sp. HI2714 TaxID=2015359 RepID=UPI0011800FF3|nr:hypothetical protein [Burkholderia sp. HI2714]
MNISRAAAPPDWNGHCWPSLVLPTRTTPARYTTRPEWSSDGESMWMRLSKFSLFNRLSLHALVGLVTVRSDEACSTGVDLRRADPFVPSRLSSILEIPEASALDGFCLFTGHPALTWATTELRYCPACLDLGFHAAWFQWRFVERCPVHRCRLRRGCRQCAAVIPYALNSSMATHPLSCVHCRTSWVPVLDRPAGRCVPITGRAARILRRWQVHVADTMMPVAITPSQPRDQVTGRFVSPPAAGIEIRMACRARHIRLLNRLYEVPPPSPMELLKRPSSEVAITWGNQVLSLPDEDRQTGTMPYARDDWPHFGNDFLAYEQVMKHVGHALFGDTRGILPVRMPGANRCDEVVIHTQDMDADHATALGWSISWYGFSRIYSPVDAPSMPAVGLTGWLAHAPHRPVHVPTDRWRDQMFVWLSEDLARSAWAWSRIVMFMRARGKYLFHAQLVRPSELAGLHQHFQGGAQPFPLSEISKNKL